MSDKRKGCTYSYGGIKKRFRKPMTLEMKNQIIKLSNGGMRNCDICRKFNLSASTVATVLKDKCKILEEVKKASPLLSTVIRKRDGLIAEMETILIVWVRDQIRLRGSVSLCEIQSKALSLFAEIKDKRGEGSSNETFQASKGWFCRFQARHNLPNQIKVQGEATSSVVDVANEFSKKLAEIIEEGGYCSRQVFNVDETGLFWKKMPSRTYIAKEEKAMPGFKPAKDRLTLLLGANAAGDFKLKPMLVYHSENPVGLKGYSKGHLPVIWKSNRKAWVTAAIFEDWFANHFVPSVKDYCEKNNHPFKALLILDSAPCHPQFIVDVNPNIKIVFLPPNVTSFLQPMDQGVIASFKAYYLKCIFAKAVRITKHEGGPTLKEFWKSFNILDSVKIIGEAWQEVKESNVNRVWKHLCPNFVEDFEIFEDPVEDITTNIVDMANQLELDVSAADVAELLQSHRQDLTSQDLHDLEEQKKEDEEVSISNSLPFPCMTAERLNEAFKMLESAMAIFEQDDANVERSSKVNASLRKDYACYTEIYLEKKKAEVQNSSNSSSSTFSDDDVETTDDLDMTPVPSPPSYIHSTSIPWNHLSQEERS